MTAKALEQIIRYRMLEDCYSITVGLSGGADSIALLHFLRGICQESGIELRAAHMNHNLRGVESVRDEAFTRKICREWAIPLEVKTLPVGKLASERRISIEECAREERYRFFRELTTKNGKIATAHNLNDNAETILFNLIRGTGLRGLCGIPPVRDNLIRPFLTCTRAEIEEYCHTHGLRYVTDSTNLTDIYARNKLRHRIMPILEELNPAYLGACARASRVLREDDDFLENQARMSLDSLRRVGGYGAAAYRAMHKAMQGRVLRLICVENGVEPSSVRIERMNRLIYDGIGTVQLSATCILKIKNGVFFCSAQSSGDEVQHIGAARFDISNIPEEGIIHNVAGKFVKLLHVNGEEFEYLYKNNRSLLKNAIDCDRINKIVFLRGRSPGDAIRLPKRGGTKSLKKLFNEDGVPIPQRSRLLVLGAEAGPLVWLEGYGAGERYQADENTAHILLVEIMGESK